MVMRLSLLMMHSSDGSFEVIMRFVERKSQAMLGLGSL